MRIQYPERIQKDVGFLTVTKERKIVKPKESGFKRYWKEEKETVSFVVPVYQELPAQGEYGEVVYCDGLYIFLNQWVAVGKSSGGGGGGGVVAVPSVGFLIEPTAEAVYATKSGGGNVYVAVTDTGRMKAVTFEASSLPSQDATTTFALTAGADTDETHSLLLYVISNQNTKTLKFSVTTDTEKNVDVNVNGSGVGSSAVDIKGSRTVTLKRRYTAESGITYPCWSACGLILFVKGVE